MTQTRALTSRVKRSAWLEPGPKLWLLLALVALLGALSVAVSQASIGLNERAIFANSDLVDAKVTGINAQYFLRNVSRNAPLNVELEVAVAGKEPLKLSGQTSVKIGENLSVGQMLPIRLDRTNPKRWTDQLEPMSWFRRMALALVLAGCAVPMLVGSVLSRMKVLKTFQEGEFVRGKIARIESSAMSPLSKQLILSKVGGGGVVKALWPQRLGGVELGDEIDLIAREHQTRALVAQRYLEE
jgi:hypothetical protein